MLEADDSGRHWSTSWAGWRLYPVPLGSSCTCWVHRVLLSSRSTWTHLTNAGATLWLKRSSGAQCRTRWERCFLRGLHNLSSRPAAFHLRVSPSGSIHCTCVLLMHSCSADNGGHHFVARGWELCYVASRLGIPRDSLVARDDLVPQDAVHTLQRDSVNLSLVA